MAGKTNDFSTNKENIRESNNFNHIKTYPTRFSRKSYSGRYGTPLVMMKTEDDKDQFEQKENEKRENQVLETVQLNETELRIPSNTLTVSIELPTQNGSIPQVHSNTLETGHQTHLDIDSQDVDQKVEKDDLNEQNKCQNDASQEIHDSVTLELPTEQAENDILFQPQSSSQQSDEVLETCIEELDNSPKNDHILKEKAYHHTLSNIVADDNTNNAQASHSKSNPATPIEKSYTSLSAYPKSEDLLSPILPDDFSDQERAYAMLSIKEWEEKGLEISKRGFQLIEKVILLRKKKEELLFQVQNMIDVHAEKLIQREESLRLRALDVRKRGRELLDEINIH